MNQYRERKPNRLSGYDYSSDGYYFVTICTKDRKEYFGKIEKGSMILNRFGEIVKERWLWLAGQYPYVQLDENVVMPNHFHGILMIDHTAGNGRERSLQEHSHSIDRQKIKPLPELIGAFKTTASKMIHKTGLAEFRWQKSFHDHIIRNDKALYRVRKYIQYNTLKWEFDRENQNDIPLQKKREFWNIFLE